MESARSSHKAATRSKIAWGSGAVADALMNNTVGVLFLAIYSLGYGLSASLLGLIMFVPRIWDMFTDPMMGNISDNTRTRWGRRRPYLPIGGALAGLFFFLMWAPSTDWGESTKLVFFLVMLLLFYTAYTIFAIPWNGLGLELSDDYADRSSVQGYRIFIAMMATFLYPYAYKFCFDFTPAIGDSIAKIEEILVRGAEGSVWDSVDFFGNWVYHKILILFQPLVESFFSLYFSVFPERASLEKVELNGVVCVGAFFGVLMFVFATIPALFTKERKDRLVRQERTGFVDAMKVVTRDKNLLSVGAAIFGIFLGFISTQALQLYINIYYVFGELPIAEAKALSGAMGGKVGIVYALVGLGSVPLIGYATRRFGKRSVMVGGLGLVACGCVLSFFLFSPGAPQMQLLLPVFFAAGLNCVWINSNSLVADICDLDELKNGKRREGIFGATLAWISKLGLAVALLLSGLIVDLTGVNPELDQLQSADTVFRMRLAYALIPTVCLFVSIYLASRCSLTEAMARETRAKLDSSAV
ncbi:MFS transporter [Pelagicoccus mobilis]|uniref:MFS transporter n=2 Tax=Pelagicoccus mobilis TaxID=415221 RepID=A0A934RVP3_9BACT|nr:MFS transporter [Pelagicoccus mobilis]